jgi:hypothetical protein
VQSVVLPTISSHPPDSTRTAFLINSSVPSCIAVRRESRTVRLRVQFLRTFETTDLNYPSDPCDILSGPFWTTFRDSAQHQHHHTSSKSRRKSKYILTNIATISKQPFGRHTKLRRDTETTNHSIREISAFCVRLDKIPIRPASVLASRPIYAYYDIYGP